MSLLQRLWLYCGPQENKLSFGILCGLLANVLKVVSPIILQQAVDNLIGRTAKSALLQECVLLVALALLQGICLFAHDRLLEGTSRDIERDMRSDLYRHLQGLPLEFFQTSRTGDLIARATNDLKVAITGGCQGFIYIMNTVVTALFIVPVMARLNWRLTLAALLPLLLAGAVSQFLNRRIQERFDKVQSHFGAIC